MFGYFWVLSKELFKTRLGGGLEAPPARCAMDRKMDGPVAVSITSSVRRIEKPRARGNGLDNFRPVPSDWGVSQLCCKKSFWETIVSIVIVIVV